MNLIPRSTSSFDPDCKRRRPGWSRTRDGRTRDVVSDTTRIAWLLFVGVSLIYVAIARGVFLYGDDILMYQVTEGIIERGSVSVTSPTASAVARAPDQTSFTAAAIPGEDGEGYAKYGIGQSLAALPFYIVADLVLQPLLPIEQRVDAFGNQYMGARIYGTALLNPVAGGGTVALTFLLAIAVGYGRRTALVLAGLLAGGTLLAHYSAGFLSEPLTALWLLMTIYGLVRFTNCTARDVWFTRRSMLWLALSGFAAGLALATRISAAVALVVPGLWLLWLLWREWRRGDTRPGTALLACVAWGAPIAFWLAVIAGYNWARFGSALESGYGDEAWMYTTPFWTGLSGLLVSPGRGVVWYDPPLLLSLAGAHWFARRRPDLALAILGMLAGTLALYSPYYVWHGGGVWGARFLVPLLPLLLLPAGEVVERAWTNRRVAVAVVVVGVLGIGVTSLGILVPFDRYAIDLLASPERASDVLWDVRDSPIVVHAESLFRDPSWPDIAAVRYASGHLALLAGVAGVLGGSLVWWATALTYRVPIAGRSVPADPQPDRLAHRGEISEQR